VCGGGGGWVCGVGWGWVCPAAFMPGNSCKYGWQPWWHQVVWQDMAHTCSLALMPYLCPLCCMSQPCYHSCRRCGRLMLSRASEVI
jgi:hypothetical protein